MVQPWVSITLAVSSVFLLTVLAWLSVEARRMRRGLLELLERLEARPHHAPSSSSAPSPEMLERVEQLERRFTTLHEDVVRVNKKTAQERRRIEKLAALDELTDEEREDLEARELADQLRNTAGAPAPSTAQPADVRPRLKRR